MLEDIEPCPECGSFDVRQCFPDLKRGQVILHDYECLACDHKFARNENRFLNERCG